MIYESSEELLAFLCGWPDDCIIITIERPDD